MDGEIISHYRVLAELGQGGMGVVYKAHDLLLGRFVALKFLPRYLTADRNEKERFSHEARAAAAINHPNVTTIYEIGEHDGQLFLAMEYVEGETLKNFLARETPSLAKVLDIAIQVAQALAAAHEKGVVHRDIKSDNIMITQKGVVKVADFGLAKLQGATKLTQAGSTLGTAAYMSPEQARGDEVDHRTDVFSLGVVLYELLAGKLPFRGEHQAALVYALMNEEPVPIARFNNEVSPEIERIVMKALAKDSAERYQHMDDLIADLRRERRRVESLQAGYGVRPMVSTPTVPPALPEESRHPVPLPSPSSVKRKNSWHYIVAGAVLVTVLLLFLVFNPFNFQVNVQQGKAAGEESSLAVLYFQNISDPDDRDHTGDMLTELLTTALSQDKALQVVSRERLYGIQKDLGEGDTKSISPTLAQKLAERAGVSMMLLGSVLQREPSLAVTARVVDVRSGRIVSSQRLSGFSAREVFALVDTLALLLRNDVTPKTVQSPPADAKPVAKVTTSSPEAYRFYLEGVELSRKFLAPDARAALNRAIALDSNFAMAYFALAEPSISTGELTRRPFLQKAWDLRARVTEKERLQIEAEYMESVMGKPEEAARALERFLEKYPYEVQAYSSLVVKYGESGQLDKVLQTHERLAMQDSLAKDAWNNLAYDYAGFKRRAEAFRAVNRYIQLSPGEPNPYDSKGEIFMMFGEVDSAVACYRQAVSLRPDFQSAEKLGWNLMLRQRYSEALSYFRQFGATSDVEQKWLARLDELLILAHQGRIRQARQLLLGLLPQMREDRVEELQAKALDLLTVFSREVGDNAALVQYASQLVKQRGLNAGEPIGGRELLAEGLRRVGDSVGSAKVLDQLRQDIRGYALFQQKRYQYALARLAFFQGEYERAVELFSRAFEIGFPNRAPRLSYGVSLLKTGRFDDAVDEIKQVITWVPISYPPVNFTFFSNWMEWPIDAVKAHYWLGMAYEQQGRNDAAAQEYRKFLEIWKEADFLSPEVKDARVRLAHLQ